MAASPVLVLWLDFPQGISGRRKVEQKGRIIWRPPSGLGRPLHLLRRRPASAALGGAATKWRVDLVLAVAEPDVSGGGEATQEGESTTVLAEHRGPERNEPAPAADACQLMQQPSSETAVLPLVVHDHRDLGVVLVRAAVVAADRDDLVAHLRDQRVVQLVVEPGQVEQRGAPRLRHR